MIQFPPNVYPIANPYHGESVNYEAALMSIVFLKFFIFFGFLPANLIVKALRVVKNVIITGFFCDK